mmetsp:Transcript_18219/g.29626  ORF Transcript_18219/g.29626 Transcript_18219/m.29626 type:complete len:234 (+) Transcript_18219:73-774(+)
MPKSKRSKVVNLTQTKSRGRARKSDLIDSIQKACDEYKTFYVFACENLRSDPLKKLRATMKDSRFVFGKNKVARLAMGKTKEEAYLPGLEKLASKLRGEVGILFTNLPAKQVEKTIANYTELDFARAGSKATKDILVKAGPIEGQPSSMYEPLRKLMLPVKLNKAVIELENDHYVCKKGDELSPEQAQALKFFGHKLAKFSIVLRYRFRDGQLTTLVEDEEEKNMSDEEEEDF